MQSSGASGRGGCPYGALKGPEKEYVKAYYRENIRPLLSPQIIDPSHPFPHLKNKALYAAALLRDGERHLLGIVGVPETAPAILNCRARQAPMCARRRS